MGAVLIDAAGDEIHRQRSDEPYDGGINRITANSFHRSRNGVGYSASPFSCQLVCSAGLLMSSDLARAV